MAALPTFIIRKSDGTAGETVKYHPIVYTRMTGVYRLALHKRKGEWQISEPISGGKIMTLAATYKGMPVSSGRFTLKQARECALLELDKIVDRIGFARFDRVITGAIEKFSVLS